MYIFYKVWFFTLRFYLHINYYFSIIIDILNIFNIKYAGKFRFLSYYIFLQISENMSALCIVIFFYK